LSRPYISKVYVAPGDFGPKDPAKVLSSAVCPSCPNGEICGFPERSVTTNVSLNVPGKLNVPEAVKKMVVPV
jgi:hypothetical protein